MIPEPEKVLFLEFGKVITIKPNGMLKVITGAKEETIGRNVGK